MAHLLAIDWDRTEARFVLASASGRTIQIRAAGSVPRGAPTGSDADAESDDAADVRLGEVLGEALKRHGIGRATVLLGVDRGSVELLHLSLPPATDDELPELVANQAARESHFSPDESVLDFLPSGDDPAQPRDVTAVILAREQRERIERIAAAARLRPRRILLRPYASASLFARTASPPEEVCLLVNRVGDEVDLTVMAAGRVAFSRTARLPEADEAVVTRRLLDEMARTLAVAVQETPGGGRVEAVYVFGGDGDHEVLVNRIRGELALRAMVVDPFVSVDVAASVAPGNPGSFASLLGMLLDEARGSRHAIDFLHPRREPPPPDRRRRWIIAAAAALAVATAGGYYVWDRLADVDAVNARLANDLKEHRALLKQANDKCQLVEAIRQWQATDVNWLDELRDLSLRFPSSRDALVTKMTLSPGRGSGGSVAFVGLVRDPAIVVRMETTIRDGFHEVRSRRVQERQQERDYTWQFDATMDVLKRDKSQYTSHLPTPPADSP
ncbi:MAG: hypothetical protein JW809_06865 [Pirellulales bacterium]|nr:hypothetical protein [Pirellulales bacterium]